MSTKHAVSGAVGIHLEKGAAIGGRCLQEVADLGAAGDEAGEQTGHIDLVAPGKSVEIGDGIQAFHAET